MPLTVLGIWGFRRDQDLGSAVQVICAWLEYFPYNLSGDLIRSMRPLQPPPYYTESSILNFLQD